jgi:hypothetical protein
MPFVFRRELPLRVAKNFPLRFSIFLPESSRFALRALCAPPLFFPESSGFAGKSHLFPGASGCQEMLLFAKSVHNSTLSLVLRNDKEDKENSLRICSYLIYLRTTWNQRKNKFSLLAAASPECQLEFMPGRMAIMPQSWKWVRTLAVS